MQPLSPEELLKPIFSREQGDDPGVKIALADYNGWWAPLTHLFYSHSSRCLVSVHPESSIETIESYYCPNCLTTFAEVETNMAANRCPKCFECPECQCILSIGELPPGPGEDARFHFVCGYCEWSSESIGLVEENPDYLGMAASVAERDSPQEERFHRLLNKMRYKAVKALEKRGDQNARVLAQTLTRLAGVMSPQSVSPERAMRRGPWRLSDLQEKEDQALRARESVDVKREAVLYPPGWALEDLASDNDVIPAEFLSMSSLDDTTRADQRLAICLHQPELKSELRPLRTPLFTKRSRRCRKDVDEGRPGILLKPKVNPLEGDSSMRSNVGRWWNKDSSAMNVLPRVSVLSLPELRRLQTQSPGSPVTVTVTGLSLVLKLVNPVYGKVTVDMLPEHVARAHLETNGSPESAAPQPYFRKRLRQCLGDPNAVLLQADLPPSWEEDTRVVLEGYEDEYLDDDEGGAMNDSAEQAIAQGALAPKDSPSRVMVFRSKYTAWMQVPISIEDLEQFNALPGPPTTFGVLVFLRYSSSQSDYTASGLDDSGAASPSSCASVIVPTLIAVKLPLASPKPPPTGPPTPKSAKTQAVASPSVRRFSSPLTIFSSPKHT